MSMAEVSVAEVLELRASDSLAELEVWNLLRGLLLAHTQGVPTDTLGPSDILINSHGLVRIRSCDAVTESIPRDKEWVCQLGHVMRSISPVSASQRLSRLLRAMTGEQPQNRPSLAGISKELEDVSGQGSADLVTALYTEVMGPAESSPPEQRKVRRIEALDCGPIFSSTPMLNLKEQPVFDIGQDGSGGDGGTPILRTRRTPQISRSLSSPSNSSKGLVKRNPVQRAPSRLYKAKPSSIGKYLCPSTCVGPEFVVRSSLPSKEILVPADDKRVGKRRLTVVLLGGQRLDVLCAPSAVTASNVLQVVLEQEGLKHSFMLGLALRVCGDLIFIPPSTPLAKVAPKSWLSSILKGPDVPFTLFVRVQLFPPTLRGVRWEAKHLLYLELRRALIEGRLQCSQGQQEILAGLALQAEFGDFSSQLHETDYFIVEHYISEELLEETSGEQQTLLRYNMQEQHQARRGLDPGRAEELFLSNCQSLRDYGGHFFRAHQQMRYGRRVAVRVGVRCSGLVVKDDESGTESHQLSWASISKLSFTKEQLVVLAAEGKFKFTFAHKMSHFVFHLASLHHQFSLRLRTQVHNTDTLSQALGVMAVQNYEPDEERDTRSIRSGLSRHSSVVLKQNKENQEQIRRPLGVRMGTRAVFESRESLVTTELTAPNSPEPTIPEAYILNASIRSGEIGFKEFNNMSMTEERILRSVTLEKDETGSLGIQVTEGSDGAVYIQAVVPGGAADKQGVVKRGDQVIAVGGQGLANLTYPEALKVLQDQCCEERVQLVLSQLYTEGQTMVASQVTAKYRKQKASLFPLSANRLDIVSALQKPVEDHYLAHIRYQTDQEANEMVSKKLPPSP